MAAVREECKEIGLTKETMAESPLKLVEQSVNATSMRQRTGSSVLSPGLHFRAPIKAAYTSSNLAALENTDSSSIMDTGRVVRKRSSLQQSLSGVISRFSMGTSTPVEKGKSCNILMNNNCNMGSTMVTGSTTPTDDAQRSSTSEYGSMADTHSTISDSRLSSPSLSRNTSKNVPEWSAEVDRRDKSTQAQTRRIFRPHAKSPSLPDVYFSAVVSSTPNLSSANFKQESKPMWNWNATSMSTSMYESGDNTSNASSPCYADPAKQIPDSSSVSERNAVENENVDGSGDTNTLRRCSAQSMREICPLLLKKLQPQQQQYVRMSGRLGGQQGRGHSFRFADSRSTDVTGGQMHEESADGKVRTGRDSDGPMPTKTAGTPAHPSANVSAQGSNCKVNGVDWDTKHYHSSMVISCHERGGAINSCNHIRHIDDEEDEEDNSHYPPSSPVNTDHNGHRASNGRVRYQQRNKRGTSRPSQVSIRKKRQQAMAEVVQARSLPDLSHAQESVRNAMVNADSNSCYEEPRFASVRASAQWSNAKPKDGIKDDQLAYATSHRLASHCSFTTSPLYAVPQKANNFDRTDQGMTAKSSPPPPPLPRKPPPPAPPSAIVSQEGANEDSVYDCGAVQMATLNDGHESAEQNGNTVAMISRKLFAEQIRVNSPIRTPDSSDTSASLILPKSVARQGYKTTFPAAVVNRRVVQVHPMCVNPITQNYEDQGQQTAVKFTSSAQYSPTAVSDSMQNMDVKLSPKPRPPVPKKPIRLSETTLASKVAGRELPVRPPKPSCNGENNNTRTDIKFECVDNCDVEFTNGVKKNGEFANVGARSSTVNGSNKVSPFKQRKQLEDEEKCRELSDYVAQRSNDSSLKRILAPNQRSSVDYLEECFTNGGALEKQTNGDYQEPTRVTRQTAYEPFGSSRGQSLALRTYFNERMDMEKEKIDLIARMSRKLRVLKEEQRAVEEEIRCNNELGSCLAAIVEQSALTKSTKDRFRQFTMDMESITQLLLKLSAQLARMDNETNRMVPGTNFSDNKEKDGKLAQRRQRLVSQLHDAKELKEDLDGRGDQVVSMLKPVLTTDQLADYQYFIQMKYKLLLDAKEIEEKIKLGEEQKCALELSLSKN